MSPGAPLIRGVATTDYVAQYADPITVTLGTEVRVERDDPEFPGWWWCVAPDGRAGWVPAELLAPPPAPGGASCLMADYTARELTIRRGTSLMVLEERAGWLFVQAPDGTAGWVPRSHVM